jgi:hypothetical protein
VPIIKSAGVLHFGSELKGGQKKSVIKRMGEQSGRVQCTNLNICGSWGTGLMNLLEYLILNHLGVTYAGAR